MVGNLAIEENMRMASQLISRDTKPTTCHPSLALDFTFTVGASPVSHVVNTDDLILLQMLDGTFLFENGAIVQALFSACNDACVLANQERWLNPAVQTVIPLFSLPSPPLPFPSSFCYLPMDMVVKESSYGLCRT